MVNILKKYGVTIMDKNIVVLDGFVCYAPSFLENPSYFPTENFQILYEVEKGNFWFESRNRIIIFLVKKYLEFVKSPTFLEIGCGTGFVLEGISKNCPDYHLEGTELYLEGLKFARSRSPHVKFFQSDATQLPFSEKYDAVASFDVIEHIEEDILALKNMYKILKPGGFSFLSVPQHMWLWSKNDDFACHKRRYTRKELKKKLLDTGFDIQFMTSFVFLLLPFMFISRLKKSQPEKMEELKLPKVLNYMLSIGMRFDEFLIKFGFSLPVGGSLFCVAKKIKKEI